MLLTSHISIECGLGAVGTDEKCLPRIGPGKLVSLLLQASRVRWAELLRVSAPGRLAIVSRDPFADEQAFADVGDTDLKCLTREVFECVCVCDMIKFSLTGSGSCAACCCACKAAQLGFTNFPLFSARKCFNTKGC